MVSLLDSGHQLAVARAHGQQRRGGFVEAQQQPFFLPFSDLSVAADEAALSRHRGDPPFRFQPPVSALDGIGVNGKLGGQIPDAGQLLPGRSTPPVICSRNPSTICA